jgi:hypothetical protein
VGKAKLLWLLSHLAYLQKQAQYFNSVVLNQDKYCRETFSLEVKAGGSFKEEDWMEGDISLLFQNFTV